jgi:hypothetical protein
MTSAVRTAHRDDVLKKAEAVYSARQRLEWAVDYAQENITGLLVDERRAGRCEDLRKELRMYLASVVGLGARDNMVELPSDDEMREIRQALHEMVEAFLAGRRFTIGEYYTRPELIEFPDGPRLIETGKYDMPRPSLARYILAGAIAEMARQGLRIKTCHAPKPRRPEGEVCGRWFVGTAKKQYCSPHCQNRAGTRASRRRRQGQA